MTKRIKERLRPSLILKPIEKRQTVARIWRFLNFPFEKMIKIQRGTAKPMFTIRLRHLGIDKGFSKPDLSSGYDNINVTIYK